MTNNPLGDLTENSMKNLRTLIDAETIIGKPIDAAEGLRIIPVSKVSFGFGSGGGDLPSSQKEKFAGGSGGGVTITPVAFIIIKNGDVRIQQIQTFMGAADRVVGMVPDVIDKVTGFIDSRKPAPDAAAANGEDGKKQV